MIMVICVLIGVIVIVVVHKRDVSGDYIEMDDDMIYVSMENGSKKPLEIRNTLYDNATTIVYRGVVDGKEDVVVKIMKMWGSKLEAGQEREMELMRKLKSDYIVVYYGTSVISGRVGIVMEYVPLGSLESLMNKEVLSGGLKIRYVREICYGMRYLHSMKIIHRDLKLSNVLVVSDDVDYCGDGICKISDFGTSRETDMRSTLSMSQSMTMTSNIGTPLYMAPEILSGQGHYSMSADVYSYGILMISLWNQPPPYSEILNKSEIGELLSGIATRDVRPSFESDCPQSYLNLSQACIVSDPHSRPSFSEICSKVFNS